MIFGGASWADKSSIKPKTAHRLQWHIMITVLLGCMLEKITYNHLRIMHAPDYYNVLHGYTGKAHAPDCIPQGYIIMCAGKHHMAVSGSCAGMLWAVLVLTCTQDHVTV